MVRGQPFRIIAHTGSEESELQYKHAKSRISEVAPLHVHSCYEIWYSLTDDVRVQVEGHTYVAHTHDVMVLNCKELHSITPDRSADYDRIVCHFRPRFLGDFHSPRYNLLGFLQKKRLGTGNLIRRSTGETAAFYN